MIPDIHLESAIKLLWQCLSLLLSLFLLAPLVLGTIRKIKARLQNRIGAAVWQPFFDLIRLYHKSETLSVHASWFFRAASALNLSIIIVVAFLVPWIAYRPPLPGSDLFLVIYLLALSRMITMLAALDTASSFGAFGASREATMALLAEPASILALAALAVVSGSSDLTTVFSFQNARLAGQPCLWLVAGVALMLTSLVELSRMPVDDPTTHLELTMVHEAMILECSGRNLALTDLAHCLRMLVLFGLTAQCYVHALPAAWLVSEAFRNVLSLIMLAVVTISTAVFEGVAVKLNWRKVPEFIAYALTMSFLCVFLASAAGLVP